MRVSVFGLYLGLEKHPAGAVWADIGRIKLLFEPEKRPAGAFWAEQIRRPFVRFRSCLVEGLPSPPHPPSALGPPFSAPLLLTNPSEAYASF